MDNRRSRLHLTGFPQTGLTDSLCKCGDGCAPVVWDADTWTVECFLADLENQKAPYDTAQIAHLILELKETRDTTQLLFSTEPDGPFTPCTWEEWNLTDEAQQGEHCIFTIPAVSLDTAQDLKKVWMSFRASLVSGELVTFGAGWVNIVYHGAGTSVGGPEPPELYTLLVLHEALEVRVDTAESDIAALAAAGVALEGRVDTTEAAITSLTAADAALDSRLDALESAPPGGDVSAAVPFVQNGGLIIADGGDSKAVKDAPGWRVDSEGAMIAHLAGGLAINVTVDTGNCLAATALGEDGVGVHGRIQDAGRAGVMGTAEGAGGIGVLAIAVDPAAAPFGVGNSGGFVARFRFSSGTADRDIEVPNKPGTLAIAGDPPAAHTHVSANITDASFAAAANRLMKWGPAAQMPAHTHVSADVLDASVVGEAGKLAKCGPEGGLQGTGGDEIAAITGMGGFTGGSFTGTGYGAFCVSVPGMGLLAGSQAGAVIAEFRDLGGDVARLAIRRTDGALLWDDGSMVVMPPPGSAALYLDGSGNWTAPPAGAGVAMIAPPLSSLADSRGVVGDMCYDPSAPMYLYHKISVSPHKWVYSTVSDTLP
jgi:hypothetical protein